MAKKNYYATIYKGEGLIWESWEKCEKFMQENPGPKKVKGFTFESDAMAWINENAAEVVENPFDKSSMNKDKFKEEIKHIIRETIKEEFKKAGLYNESQTA